MALKYEGGKTSKVYSAELNNIAYQNNRGVLSGCGVSLNSGLMVDCEEGRVFFGNDIINVSNISITLSTNLMNSNPRIDLIVVNSLGVVSAIQGTPSAIPMTPDYDPDDYVCLAIIRLEANASTIQSSNVRDIRVLNIGGGGTAGGGAFARHVESFTGETSITVTHNLGDDEPLVFIYNDSNELISASSVEVININSVLVTFSLATSGKVVIYGGVGLNNGYYFREFSSALTWTVTHNLNNKYVHVVCYDSTDKIIEPQDIEIIDENSLEITFGIATEGKVSVTGGVSTSDLFQYNFVNIDSMLPDELASPDQDLVGVNPCIKFNDTTNDIVYFSFAVPRDYRLASDIVCELTFCMDGANVGESVVLNLDSNTLTDGDGGEPLVVHNETTETILVPNTADELKKMFTTTLMIPGISITMNDIISCSFYRNSVSASDTASGDFKLLNIRLRYEV